MPRLKRGIQIMNAEATQDLRKQNAIFWIILTIQNGNTKIS